jgi:hypothetical protein
VWVAVGVPVDAGVALQENIGAGIWVGVAFGVGVEVSVDVEVGDVVWVGVGVVQLNGHLTDISVAVWSARVFVILPVGVKCSVAGSNSSAVSNGR